MFGNGQLIAVDRFAYGFGAGVFRYAKTYGIGPCRSIEMPWADSCESGECPQHGIVIGENRAEGQRRLLFPGITRFEKYG